MNGREVEVVRSVNVAIFLRVWSWPVCVCVCVCRVIHKSLRDFRPLRYSGWDGDVEGEHVNRGRDTPSFCRTLQVPDMSTLVIKFLSHTLHMCDRNLITGLTSATSPRVNIPSTSKVGQKLGVSLPLLTCSPSVWPSRLLYRRGRKSRRDLRITLYTKNKMDT